MRDFFGQPLSPGDVVAFVTKHYRDLTIGTVVALTAKQVRVEYVSDIRTNTTEQTLRYPSVMVRRPV